MTTFSGLRELFILRHAKSDHNHTNLVDFERPLSDRGRADALKMGQWMNNQALIPDNIIVSPSKRTLQTLKRIRLCIDKTQQIPCRTIDRIYEATLTDLLDILSQIIPEQGHKILLIGHNPGLAQLLGYLTNQSPTEEINDDAVLFPTTALAHVVLPMDWSNLTAGCGKLINLWQAKHLPTE